MQLKPTSIAFLKAFYLGNRNEIPEDITSDYKNAGVLHILALSGLHVGILLLFFKLLLRPLLWIKKGGQIRSISIICLLWIFALITGLSPSIVRAVSMFSLFVIAEMLNRQTNSINTLLISAFITNKILIFQSNNIKYTFKIYHHNLFFKNVRISFIKCRKVI